MPAWLPKSGLLREHFDYCIWATDAPGIFHVASMLTTIAAAVADTASLIVAGDPHPLNIWTMLVGRSSADRKTTATRLAVSRLEHVCNERVQRIYGSPEGFISNLEQEPCALLYIPEGQAFFEQREASYWRHAKGIFMDLYDYTETFRRQLAKTEIEVKNPRLSLLSACAQPLLDYHTKPTDWLGGFLPRFLMVMGTPREFKPGTRANQSAEKRIEDMLYNVHNASWGNIACTSTAQQVLESFAYEIYGEIDAYPEGLHPSLHRLGETATRLSALYEISFHADDPPQGKITMVSAVAAQHAVALCRESRDIALMALAELSSGVGAARDLDRTEAVIRQYGLRGVSRSELLRLTKMKTRDFDSITDTLVERDAIGYRQVATSGRPVTMYVHVEAQADAVRSSRNLAIDPEPTTWISVEGESDHVLDGLADVERDDDDDGGTHWN